MKTTVSFNTVNRNTSGPGAFMRAAKWYWDEVTDMVAAAGFDSVTLNMVPDTPNDARNGAPVCTGALNSQYGSASDYLAFLNDRGIHEVSCMTISAQSLMDTMFENGTSMDHFFDEFYRYAEDVCKALKILGGTILLVSPTPAVGPLTQYIGDDAAAVDQFLRDTASCLGRIGEMSDSMGIHTCIKNDFWTLVRGEKIRDLLNQLDPAYISFAPDTAQLKIAGADYLRLIDEYADNMKCVFLTDTRYEDTTENYRSISPEYPQSGPMQRCYCDLGYGTLDFAAVFASLKKHGFDGTVVLESRYTLDVPKAILRMRTFWNRLQK